MKARPGPELEPQYRWQGPKHLLLIGLKSIPRISPTTFTHATLLSLMERHSPATTAPERPSNNSAAKVQPINQSNMPLEIANALSTPQTKAWESLQATAGATCQASPLPRAPSSPERQARGYNLEPLTWTEGGRTWGTVLSSWPTDLLGGRHSLEAPEGRGVDGTAFGIRFLARRSFRTWQLACPLIPNLARSYATRSPPRHSRETMLSSRGNRSFSRPGDYNAIAREPIVIITFRKLRC